MDKTKNIYLYHFEPTITVLGPGRRSVIWFQGCRFACEGCLVPDSWEFKPATKVSIKKIIDKIKKQKSIEGVTISGGEPFLQINALAKLIDSIKKIDQKLTIMIYTGFKFEELLILSKQNKAILKILKNCDILIDGKFEQQNQINDPWRGSSNQKIHFLSKVYNIDNYKNAHISNEIHIEKNGNIFVSGIPNKKSVDQDILFKKII